MTRVILSSRRRRRRARGLSDFARPVVRRRVRPATFAVVAASVVAHLVLFSAMTAQVRRPPLVDPVAMTVALVDASLLTPPSPPASSKAAPAEVRPERKPADPAPPKPAKPVVAPSVMLRASAPRADPAPPLAAGDSVAELSAAQLGRAATADSPPEGGACNMVRWLQGALRRNAKVLAAVSRAHGSGAGKAIVMWNGSWVRTTGEDGAGLAGVREAIMMEIAFAPEACREPRSMDRVVLISLKDDATAPKLALGTGTDPWRWSDLVGARPAG